MTLTEEIFSQLPEDVLSKLRRADRLLTSIREDSAPVPQVVKQSQLPLGTVDWDVVVSGVELSQLKLQRALSGFFPSYRHPLRTPWSRILPVGDSSSNQSPLSFGGFGAMVRHLKRLTGGIHEALSSDRLSSQALALLQPYQPNLTVTWLFQRAMSAGVEQKIVPDRINQLLCAVFLEMSQLGDPVLKPFLQDVVQFPALTRTLLKTALAHPVLVARVIPQVGLGTLLDWMVHYINLGAYSALSRLGQASSPWVKNLPSVPQYYCHRWIEAWKYGSGGDFSS